ncbi:MAG: hypothetical protein HGB32_12885 [Geobacteraceae bacterium]|nr:hypothetical protein [Geobacteraceae bacterium]NTW81023.1 hypothetical protein [Geobacteraceae bacterium]
MAKILVILFFTLVTALSAASAQATISTDLQALTIQGNNLRNTLATISVSSGDTCSQLGSLNISIENYLTSIQGVYNQIVVPINVTSADQTALEELSGIAKDLASDSVRLSFELRTLEGVANLFEYRAALSAMLRLSDDIGTMANRILEMADRILAMADNIGTMADRILITQQIQNSNIAFTQGSLLATQQNIVALSGSLSTIGYNLSLGLLLNDTKNQLTEMNGVTLDSSNIATQLSYFETKTALLMIRSLAIYTLVTKDSQNLSHYIDGDTLTLLGDLSIAQNEFAIVLEKYAATINQIAPLMQTPLLSDATGSMLRLTTDVNIMSKRIIEMNSRITVMADNIGLMTDRIVLTQNLQQANIELTQSSILASQNITLSVIKNFIGQ